MLRCVRVTLVALMYTQYISMARCACRPVPMAHSYRLGLVTCLVTCGYQARIAVGPDICHLGCAYTVFQTVQKPGVYSAAYGTVHYKEPLKSFGIRVGHIPGFLLSIAMIVQKAT